MPCAIYSQKTNYESEDLKIFAFLISCAEVSNLFQQKSHSASSSSRCD